MHYTFSTGRTIEVIPISPWVLEVVRESVPWPEPPKQTVEGPEGLVEVPNTQHPEYLKALDDRQTLISERQQELIIEEGTSFEVDKAAVDKRRATLGRLDAKLPERAATDDRHFYLYYICVGSQQDLDNLIRLIHGLSLVGEEAVAKATESFRP